MNIINMALCTVAAVIGVLCVKQMLMYCLDILKQPNNGDFYGEE